MFSNSTSYKTVKNIYATYYLKGSDPIIKVSSFWGTQQSSCNTPLTRRRKQIHFFKRSVFKLFRIQDTEEVH
jgi:hypothetical protein